MQRPQDHAQTLYCARLEQWPESTDPEGHWEMPRGNLLQLVGQSGDVEAETVAILSGQMVDYEDFPDDVSTPLFRSRSTRPFTSQTTHSDTNRSI